MGIWDEITNYRLQITDYQIIKIIKIIRIIKMKWGRGYAAFLSAC